MATHNTNSVTSAEREQHMAEGIQAVFDSIGGFKHIARILDRFGADA